MAADRDERAALVEAAVRGAVLGGASRQVAAAVAAAAIRCVRSELPSGRNGRAPAAGACEEAAADQKKKKRKRRKRKRRGKPREGGDLAPVVLERSSDGMALDDEWADDLPPRRVAEVFDLSDATWARGRLLADSPSAVGGAAPLALPAAVPVPASPVPASLPASPTRVLTKHSSRERSPRRAAAPAEPPLVVGCQPPPPLVVGCLATCHGLDVRADLNGSEVLLRELDASSMRWRAETLAGEVVRVKADRLRFHSLPP